MFFFFFEINSLFYESVLKVELQMEISYEFLKLKWAFWMLKELKSKHGQIC